MENKNKGSYKAYSKNNAHGSRGDKPFGSRNSNSNPKTFRKSDKSFRRDDGNFSDRKKSYEGSDKKFTGEKKSFGRSDRKFSDEKKSFGRHDRKFSGENKSFGRPDRKFSGEKHFSSDRKPEFGRYDDKRKSFSKSEDAPYKNSRSDFKNNDKKQFQKERPVRNSFANGEKSYSDKNRQAPKKDTKSILDTRLEIALQALIDIEKNGKYINLAFKHNDKLDRLEKKDRSYVMRILYGVTEKSFTIDWILQKVLKDKRIKPWLNAILRMGTYQIFYMRIEDDEAIVQATELCRKYVSDELCGFVTAILSKISENKDEFNPELYKFKGTSERLSVIYSYPQWLIDMWIKDYGLDTVNTLLENESERAINLRVSTKTTREDVINTLTEAEIKCFEGSLYNTVTISDTVNIETLECYQNGLVTAQGIGSMLTVDALNVKNNSTVLDACAAPGGKTFYIAEKTRATVESCDIHEHRVDLINKGAQRLQLDNVHTVCRDMTEFVPEYENEFDRVLVDAPCSGLGMISSKPDIKNNITEDAINELCDVQAKILDTCSNYVKKGGILLYSTCTVSKKENNENVKKFLETHNDFELMDISDTIPEIINHISDEKTTLILPSKYNSDAFFIAVMCRQ